MEKVFCATSHTKSIGPAFSKANAGESLWRKFGEDVLDTILLDSNADDDEDDDDNTDGNSNRKRKKVPLWKRKPLRTHFVQIAITSMHQVSFSFS